MSDDIPEHCPGTQSEDAGKASACAGCPNQSLCSSGATKGEDPGIGQVKERLSGVKHRILVLSGKGGVGKSTFTSLLARSLAEPSEDTSVAILDIDICGPSQPRIMGILNEQVHASGSGWCPVYVKDNLAVMSTGFLLGSADDAVIWRGPKKNSMIKDFLSRVDWDDNLDYLIIDTPPGTSDEHLSAVTYLKGCGKMEAVVVTTPHEFSLLDVRKELDFCKKVGIHVIGVVENMANFICPKCQGSTDIFPATTGGARQMCEEFGVPFLGSLCLDPRLTRACDEGKDTLEELSGTLAYQQLKSIVSNIIHALDSK